ncbi:MULTISPECIES: ASCH domain-containing protein [unclassified Lactobacillus]|uniref:ASCH domain-containing protein n=1 Tax=unclassified Lactobacillus TaxID=2620435 RepID=UPI000EFD318F|nr:MULTISPECIES: ASCH domain-containing protein [unclassified Lactobacillus]RMC23490.1 ASCH domain-containing protein [Lactobacillus sp. ESL0247]RMC27287.1 ASCH domain-containing protein [Lactobacillus sp. ESL0246]RMC30352.1 ASCH domain-containing protein [Lactobacillus sp. ESL0245]
MNEETIKYWQDFCQKHQLPQNTLVTAWSFDTTSDKLANLVKQGLKTATTSAYELYAKDEPLPQVGDWNIILDHAARPICVVQDKVVEIISYEQISAEHAYHEGEGDRSYQYWRQIHDEFFRQEYQQEGNKEFYPQAPMVCEVFEKID